VAKDLDCPLYKEPCHEHTCRWYTRVLGKSPQTGNDIDEFGCAVEWIPVLLIEVSKETRQAAAATESFRNEMAKGDLSNRDTFSHVARVIRDALAQQGGQKGRLVGNGGDH